MPRMMYTAISAARIRIGVLLSELWNACALPWKLVAIEGGRWSSRVARWIAVTAAPIEVFGGRLKLRVTDGNWPWWLTAIGATVEVMVANWLSGTWVPLAEVAYMRLSASGPS